MTKPEMLEAMLGQLSELRDPAGFYNAGIPNYDHLFGRDACVSALQLLHREPEAAKATLLALTKYQGRRRRLRREEWPGKIMHEHYPYGLLDMLDNVITNDNRFHLILNLILWRFPYYGSIDAGAWCLILLHHYHRQTGDAQLVRQLWPAVQRVIHWYDHHATHPRGLVTFRSHFHFGLKMQSWKDGTNYDIVPPVAMVEVQGYYYYALNLLAELAQEVMGDAAGATALEARATALKAEFDTAFAPQDGIIPMAMGADGLRHTSAVSNPGQLLFTGILGREQRELVVRRLFAPDMVTPYGIRTEASTSVTFDPLSYQNGSVWPFDNWVIHQGLQKAGYIVEAQQIKTGLVGVFEAWQQLPELYGVSADGELLRIKRACRIQAWSGGGLVNLQDDAPLL